MEAGKPENQAEAVRGHPGEHTGADQQDTTTSGPYFAIDQHRIKSEDITPVSDLGLIGLAVMGQNLILNMADHGFHITAYNRTVSKVKDFVENEAKGKNIVGTFNDEDFIATLKKPRRIMLLVQAGSAVDAFIMRLRPYLEKGDIIIDGGNSHFPDTNRRRLALNPSSDEKSPADKDESKRKQRLRNYEDAVASLTPPEPTKPDTEDPYEGKTPYPHKSGIIDTISEKLQQVFSSNSANAGKKAPKSEWDDYYEKLWTYEAATKPVPIAFVGSGVSGGEEGARNGPSLMPGGDEQAWPHIKDIFQSIAAKSDGEACCDWVGDDGAGHYVKMVHNGIEYGDMQLICEAYDVLKRGLGLKDNEIGDIFEKWNTGVLDSFLIEITKDILHFNDEDGTPLVEKILDSAGQKGTGKWTAANALDLGMPVTLIGEAVFARCLSSLKEERTRASEKLEGPTPSFEGDKQQFIDNLEQGLYASKIISYAQGFMLMQTAAKDYGWKLNKPSIALMWRGGCIIRSVFLKDITSAYRDNPDLENLLFNDFFNKAIHKAQPGWRDVVSKAILWGIPMPAFTTALSFFDGYRTKNLPASLLQAQRDYFGAHTFRVKPEFVSDKLPKDQNIHINWTGRGGNVSASTYQA